MADYITSELIAAFGHQFEGLADSTAVDLLVTSASRLFDNLCDVPEDFFAPAGDEESDKDFIGDGTAYLKLLPYTSLNDTDPVLMNDGDIDDPDYTADNVPDYVERNGTLVVLNKTMRHDQNNYYTGVNRFVGWPDGKQIRVSAKWGFVDTPADVQIACVHIAYQLFRTADPSFSIISGIEGAQVANFRLPAMAQAVVDSYRGRYSQKGLFA